MIVDLVANYSAYYQDEIKAAAYPCNETITIHPIVMYYHPSHGREGPFDEPDLTRHVFTTISGDNEHDYNAVEYYIEFAFQIISASHVTDDRMYKYSDGCSAQFTSKGHFKRLYWYNVLAERHYFGFKHGKSEADGYSNVVKRSPDAAVKSTQLMMKNVKDMYKWVSNHLKLYEPSSKRHFINVYQGQVPGIPDDLTTIKGTRKIHQVANIPAMKDHGPH